jgi:hypothetical protein
MLKEIYILGRVYKNHNFQKLPIGMLVLGNEVIYEDITQVYEDNKKGRSMIVIYNG